MHPPPRARSLLLLCKSWGPPQGSGPSAEHRLCSTDSLDPRKTTGLWATRHRPKLSQNPAGVNPAWRSHQPSAGNQDRMVSRARQGFPGTTKTDVSLHSGLPDLRAGSDQKHREANPTPSVHAGGHSTYFGP